MKIYYKVLDEDNCSSVIRRAERVQYIPNKWVRAPKHCADRGYHLLVFDNLEAAKKFCCYGPIWECHIRSKIKELPPRKELWKPSNIYWKIEGIDWGNDDSWGWPRGTVMAREVMILEKVQ